MGVEHDLFLICKLKWFAPNQIAFIAALGLGATNESEGISTEDVHEDGLRDIVGIMAGVESVAL